MFFGTRMAAGIYVYIYMYIYIYVLCFYAYIHTYIPTYIQVYTSTEAFIGVRSQTEPNLGQRGLEPLRPRRLQQRAQAQQQPTAG